MDAARQPEHRPELLPGHLPIPTATRIFYAVSCITAGLLTAGLIGKFVAHAADFSLLMLPVIPAGMLFADFLSGLIHWFADTWGSESMPVLGKRLLHPFRIHHVNPGDFLQRKFFDTNGDVAFLAIPVLVACWFISLTTPMSAAAALFLAASSATGMLTNQIHQWAHMRQAPLCVRWLQQCGLILSHNAHQQHHEPPWVANYCITTGWCNRPLQAIQFFRRLERLITRVTGVQPRTDEIQFSQCVTSERPLR
jgi:DNA polymerase III psi subunit